MAGEHWTLWNPGTFCQPALPRFLHELLRRQGCVLDCHPAIPGTPKHPDLLVRPASGETFILEARTSTDVASGPESHPRADRIRDFLRQLKLDGYKLGIDELTAGTGDLPHKPLRKHIIDALAADPGNDDGIVRIKPYSTTDGWDIRLTAFSCNRYGANSSKTVTQEGWGRTWMGPSYPLPDVLDRDFGDRRDFGTDFGFRTGFRGQGFR